MNYKVGIEKKDVVTGRSPHIQYSIFLILNSGGIY